MSSNKSRGVGVRYTMSIGEGIYFFCRKKNCPKCGGTMGKFKDYSIKTIHDVTFDAIGSSSFKDYKFHFICTVCNSSFPLSELAKRRGK